MAAVLGLALVLGVVLSGCVLATTTTLSVSSANLPQGQPLTLTARVAATTVPTGTVTFSDGGVTLGYATLNGGIATLTTSSLGAGTHLLVASYGAQGSWGGSTSAPVAVTITASATRYQLSLGDSLGAGIGAPSGQGYVAAILAHEQSRLAGLQGANLSCSGATTTSMLNGGGCSYAEGSQLAAAEAFLRNHPGQVAYVTIDIGANDITSCFGGGTINLTCAQGRIATVQTNLTTILSRLRAAGGNVPIFGMTYYDPFLAYWVAGNPTAAEQSQQVAATGNAAIAAVYAAAQAQVADVEAAFGSADWAMTGTYGGQVVPQNVSNVCAWTWMCSNWDIHANATGHQRIAATFTALIDATVS
jgi:lysophospholipase L1-like esterase